MAADKVGLRDQISRANWIIAHAQVRDRQAPGLFRVVDEVTLGKPRRRVTDNFDVVFGRRDAAVAA